MPSSPNTSGTDTDLAVGVPEEELTNKSFSLSMDVGMYFATLFRLWSAETGYSIPEITGLAIKAMRARCDQAGPATGGCP
jgi:hypothetical protein